ncbi:hypothetical protein BA059_12785 [Mycolicibacterium sp. (ex Dasyatis americana)]|uniref:hypothetical protein n=1 Tax=Mycobacterium sp. CnD-18-1 TaxID=2917744 RepID=UPI000872000B|nr:hypothetical protein [Mycobacterium sp. CnD-18-1]MCG7608114.1 hypothetical protein [Mycobacterium sp. CnD-18-1]OFB39199.1 hypothetical protein BA059_12785 [Mycolicibacterium sp. (ex Dasyatis americana)]
MTTEQPPPVSEENRKEAERIMQSYDDSRPTVTLPGSNGTVSGTSVNDWVDDDGKPIYGDTDTSQ